MSLELVRRLIARPDAAAEHVLRTPPPGVFFVDWREADDDIVTLAAAAMRRDNLVPEWIDGVLHIAFDGRRVPVPLRQVPGEQDVTLEALNAALGPAFEVRYLRASEGGDTAAMLVLPGGDWRALEAEFGDALDAAAAKLDRSAPIFAAPDSNDVTARIEAGNPGLLARLHFARALFRIVDLEVAESSRAAAIARGESPALLQPLAGNLAIEYFHERVHGPQSILESELASHAATAALVHELAIARAIPAWDAFRIESALDVSRVVPVAPLAAPSLALCTPHWRAHSAVVAIFPREDAMFFAPADRPDAVAALVEALDVTPQAFSRLLYHFDGERWQSRAPRRDERRLRQWSHWRNAEAGDIHARFVVAELYRFFALHDEAVKHYWIVADRVAQAPVDSKDMFRNGSAALCNLADKYEHGLGVAQDHAQAATLYRRAAQLDNAVAQYDLAMLYRRGLGVERDDAKARTWLRRSAAQGFQPAIDALAAA